MTSFIQKSDVHHYLDWMVSRNSYYQKPLFMYKSLPLQICRNIERKVVKKGVPQFYTEPIFKGMILYKPEGQKPIDHSRSRAVKVQLT